MNPTLSIDGGDVVGQVGMTLATIAYARAADIAGLLALPQLATGGHWKLRWVGTDAANQVYVAKDERSGQLAVVIRGSVTDPMTEAFWLDWFDQDLEVLTQRDWPHGGAPAGVRVSQGSLDGLKSLSSLRSIAGQSLEDALAAERPFRWLTAVVGHSLGGALASVLAPYLHQKFSPGKDDLLDFWPVTFAGPTAGNGAFASWLDSRFVASLARYHNDLDVVPHSWQDLAWIASSFPGGPKLPSVLAELVEGVKKVLSLLDDKYVQPGAGVPLKGALAKKESWFEEAGTQHGSATYLKLLGAPPVPVGAGS